MHAITRTEGETLDIGGFDEAPHRRLARMVGEWAGECRLWFERDMLAAESTQRGTLRCVLGGRFLLHDYVWAFDGRRYAGLALLGYHVDARRWECAWVDSFHTGTAILQAQAESPGEPVHFSVLGRHGETEPGAACRWRTEIDQPEDDRLSIVMTRLSPSGEETRAVEVDYRRVG
jgi:hypothetical protein